MNLEMRLSTGTLYNGQTSVYAKVTVGRRTWWISRWDTPRVLPVKEGERIFWSSPIMTWYGGRRTP